MFESWFQASAQAAVVAVLRRIRHGRLTIVAKYGAGGAAQPTTQVFGSPDTVNGGTGHDVTVVFHTPNAWVRICQAFDLGFSEAYMAQEVDCADLVGLFSLYIANRDELGFSGNSILHQLLPRLSHTIFRPKNDITHARLHASYHYDTSNAMFSNFLSADMNYSSALWSGLPDESLESAQLRKVHNIIDKARISSSDHVLDIGCGWGHLAIEAVKRTGCRVTGLTLSVEQKALAEERIRAEGLQDKIDLLLCDYRQAPRPADGYDRIVSVEMIEHVGDKFMNEYFQTISSLLKPRGGVMVVQGITHVNSIANNPENVDTFIERYVFPGGYLPTAHQLLTSIHVGSKGALEVDTVQNIGPHYIKTLVCWRENFLRNWETIRKDFVAKHPDASEQAVEAFRRRWLYYFMCCEAGFRGRILNDYVVSAVRTPEEPIEGDVSAHVGVQSVS